MRDRSRAGRKGHLRWNMLTALSCGELIYELRISFHFFHSLLCLLLVNESEFQDVPNRHQRDRNWRWSGYSRNNSRPQSTAGAGWSVKPIQAVRSVTEDESRHLTDWFLQLILENHDLQVRHRWVNPNDVAIWDNRSMYHTATYDYEGPRQGQRAVSLGERPYLDPLSTGRREGLATKGVKV